MTELDCFIKWCIKQNYLLALNLWFVLHKMVTKHANIFLSNSWERANTKCWCFLEEEVGFFWLLLKVRISDFSPLVRRHLSTTFYGSYFNRHITQLNVTNSRWTSVCSFHVLLYAPVLTTQDIHYLYLCCQKVARLEVSVCKGSYWESSEGILLPVVKTMSQFKFESIIPFYSEIN